MVLLICAAAVMLPVATVTATSSPKMTHSAQRPISFFVAFRSVQRRRSEDVILQLPTVLKYIIIVGTLQGRQAVCRAV